MTHKLITNGTLIDGTGRDPVRNGAVLVKGNRIVAAGKGSEIPRPAETTVIDAGGGTILPGFIDTHVHFFLEELDLLKTMTKPFSYGFYEVIDRMKRTLDAGVTSVRDAGGTDFGVKMAVEEGLIAGPRMQISISVLSTTGGHGDTWLRSGQQFGFFLPYPGHPGFSVICNGVEDVRRKVREILRAGAEVIKVCSTGGVGSPTDHPEFTQFTPEELAVMVQEGAYRQGIKVMSHAQGAEGIKNAVQAGIHSIEHGIYIDEEAMEMMKARGTFLVPTLVAPIGVLESGQKSAGVPQWAVQKAQETVEAHAENIAAAYQAGVRIAMGTDAGVIPHGDNLRELGLMADIGMSPMDVITATTRDAAACLGWEKRVGTLEPGKLADVVLTPLDALDNLHALSDRNHISLVMKDGEVVKDIRGA